MNPYWRIEAARQRRLERFCMVLGVMGMLAFGGLVAVAAVIVSGVAR